MNDILAEAGQVSPIAGWATLAVLAAVTLSAYALACWLAPYGKCRWCRGTGRRVRWTSHHATRCRHCKGTRRALRHGRRAWNYLYGKRQAS